MSEANLFPVSMDEQIMSPLTPSRFNNLDQRLRTIEGSLREACERTIASNLLIDAGRVCIQAYEAPPDGGLVKAMKEGPTCGVLGGPRTPPLKRGDTLGQMRGETT